MCYSLPLLLHLSFLARGPQLVEKSYEILEVITICLGIRVVMSHELTYSPWHINEKLPVNKPECKSELRVVSLVHMVLAVTIVPLLTLYKFSFQKWAPKWHRSATMR